MKKGRQGTRIEILCRPEDAARFEALLLRETTTIGVRRSDVDRVMLPREEATVDVLGHSVRAEGRHALRRRRVARSPSSTTSSASHWRQIEAPPIFTSLPSRRNAAERPG